MPSTRRVSSAVGVATYGLSSSTYTPHRMVHRVRPAVSVESLRRLAAVRLRTNGSTTRVGPPSPAWASTNGFVPQSLSSHGRSGANLAVPTADYVRFGAHYGFWPIGASGWVSVRCGAGEEHQMELAHLNLVAVG